VQTAAKGTADLSYDPATRMLIWSVTYNGLSGPATMAHFHGPAVEGKNGPPVIWLAEKGATVNSPIKGQATLTQEQAQQLTAGEWYINVHTQANHGQPINSEECSETADGVARESKGVKSCPRLLNRTGRSPASGTAKFVVRLCRLKADTEMMLKSHTRSRGATGR
jgi:hypothetical protein